MARKLNSKRIAAWLVVIIIAGVIVAGTSYIWFLSAAYGHGGDQSTRIGYTMKNVQRIPGDTPQDMAVAWAGYKDQDMSKEWWLYYRSRSIGWGISEPGHNIILANPSYWQAIMPSGLLSHMGKHAFFLLTNADGSLPEKAVNFIELLKPTGHILDSRSSILLG